MKLRFWIKDPAQDLIDKDELKKFIFESVKQVLSEDFELSKAPQIQFDDLIDKNELKAFIIGLVKDALSKADIPEAETKGFKLQSWEDIGRALILLKGGNPDAQQTLNDFTNFDSEIERSNFPLRGDVQLIAFLLMCGETFYPTIPNDPFTRLAKIIAIVFMAKGGEKAKQVVELFRNTPNMADFQRFTTMQTPQNRSLIDKALGRNKAEAY